MNLYRDRTLAIKDFKEKPFPISKLSKKLKNDKELALLILDKYGSNFKNFDYDLQLDKDIVLTAVKQNGLVLKDVSIKFKHDFEIIDAALNKNPLALEYVTNKMKTYDLIKKTITKDGYALKYAKNFNENEEICLIALKSNYYSFDYISSKLKNDKNFILKAIDITPLIYSRLNKSLLKDEDILDKIIKTNKTFIVFNFIPNSIKNKEFILNMKFATAFNYKNLPDKLKLDKDIIDFFIKKDATCLQYFNEELKSNKNIVRECIKNNPFSLKYASETLKKDKDFLLTIAKEQKHLCAHIVEESFLFMKIENNLDYYTELFFINPRSTKILFYNNKKLNELFLEKFWINIIKTNKNYIKYLPLSLKNDLGFLSLFN